MVDSCATITGILVSQLLVMTGSMEQGRIEPFTNKNKANVARVTREKDTEITILCKNNVLIRYSYQMNTKITVPTNQTPLLFHYYLFHSPLFSFLCRQNTLCDDFVYLNRYIRRLAIMHVGMTITFVDYDGSAFLLVLMLWIRCYSCYYHCCFPFSIFYQRDMLFIIMQIKKKFE